LIIFIVDNLIRIWPSQRSHKQLGKTFLLKLKKVEEIKLFIQKEIMDLAFKKVGFEDSLIKSKLLDSITVVDLLVSIEEEIGRKIPQHLINEENMDTIDKIVNTISNI
jgi:acyl carrier protein